MALLDTTVTERELLRLKDEFLRSRAAFSYRPVSEQQAKLSVDFPAKGPVWVSRTEMEPPHDDGVLNVISAATSSFGTDGEEMSGPSLANVKVQWLSTREGVGAKEPEPRMGEREKYREMERSITSPMVLFCVHGGYFFTGGPASSRSLTRKLAAETSARVLSVDYRLAPQHIYPSALVDLLVAYLSLLYPTDTAFHAPVAPEDIVFVGESAGAYFFTTLLLLIRYIKENTGGKVRFNGKDVLVPMPAGCASFGAQIDCLKAFPWTALNYKFCIATPLPPYLTDKFTPDHLWPANPPRGEIMAPVSALVHPLVTPLAAPRWTSFPPMYLAYGEEMMGQEGLYMATRVAETGVPVEYHYYQRLPHVFPLLYPQWLPSRHLVRHMAAFCTKCVDRSAKGQLTNRFITYAADLTAEPQGIESPLPRPEVVLPTHEEILQRMRWQQRQRKDWTGPDGAPSVVAGWPVGDPQWHHLVRL